MNANFVLRRRQFATLAAALGTGNWFSAAARSQDPVHPPLSVSRELLWSNLDGNSTTWFHPRACMIPQPTGQLALMTLQSIRGSDYFGPVHWTSSANLGKTWTVPEPIPALGRKPVPGHPGLEAGVCDVVPQYHPQTDSVLALGQVVFYRGTRFAAADQLPRYPVYAIRRTDGTWSESKKLDWDDPRGTFIYSNNCGQRIVLPNGDILLAFTFGAQSEARSVASVRCGYDGSQLTIRTVGSPLSHAAGRGLLEPSLVEFQRRYFLTIRAEDNYGYVSASDDGLAWAEKRAWAWDDGELIAMSSTQQHWLVGPDALYLVYTRKDPTNINVIRWRAPLFIAQVEPQRLCLIRDSEVIVHPLVGNGITGADAVALMGNFHVTQVSDHEAWVTVGAWLPKMDSKGETLLARVRWDSR